MPTSRAASTSATSNGGDTTVASGAGGESSNFGLLAWNCRFSSSQTSSARTASRLAAMGHRLSVPLPSSFIGLLGSASQTIELFELRQLRAAGVDSPDDFRGRRNSERVWRFHAASLNWLRLAPVPFCADSALRGGIGRLNRLRLYPQMFIAKPVAAASWSDSIISQAEVRLQDCSRT